MPGSRTFVITSPAMAINKAQTTRITCLFFPNASMTASASAYIPRWISFGRKTKERHENNHRNNERERDVRPPNQADSHSLLQTARTTLSCNTRKVNNNKQKEENHISVQSIILLRKLSYALSPFSYKSSV